MAAVWRCVGGPRRSPVPDTRLPDEYEHIYRVVVHGELRNFADSTDFAGIADRLDRVFGTTAFHGDRFVPPGVEVIFLTDSTHQV